MLVVWRPPLLNALPGPWLPSPQLHSGLVQVSIGPLAEESLGGSSVVAVLDVPRLTADQLSLPPAAQLAVSALFDPLAPHSHVLHVPLDVRPDNALEVKVEVELAAVERANCTTSGGGAWLVYDVDGSEVVALEPGTETQVREGHRRTGTRYAAPSLLSVYTCHA